MKTLLHDQFYTTRILLAAARARLVVAPCSFHLTGKLDWARQPLSLAYAASLTSAQQDWPPVIALAAWPWFVTLEINNGR